MVIEQRFAMNVTFQVLLFLSAIVAFALAAPAPQFGFGGYPGEIFRNQITVNLPICLNLSEKRLIERRIDHDDMKLTKLLLLG